MDIWQNQYNIVKFKNKNKKRKLEKYINIIKLKVKQNMFVEKLQRKM